MTRRYGMHGRKFNRANRRVTVSKASMGSSPVPKPHTMTECPDGFQWKLGPDGWYCGPYDIPQPPQPKPTDVLISKSAYGAGRGSVAKPGDIAHKPQKTKPKTPCPPGFTWIWHPNWNFWYCGRAYAR